MAYSIEIILSGTFVTFDHTKHSFSHCSPSTALHHSKLYCLVHSSCHHLLTKCRRSAIPSRHHLLVALSIAANRWSQWQSVSPSRKSKVSLSLHPAACLKKQCKGLFFYQNDRRFISILPAHQSCFSPKKNKRERTGLCCLSVNPHDFCWPWHPLASRFTAVCWLHGFNLT